MTNRSKYLKKWKADRIRQGLCVECGKPNPDQSKTRCQPCIEIGLKRAMRWYNSNKLKRAKYCKQRWKNKKFATQSKRAVRDRARRLRKNGLCVKCQVPSKTYLCPGCSLKYYEWRRGHTPPPEVVLKKKAYQKLDRARRLKQDPGFKLACSLRIRLCRALAKKYKTGSAVRDLGCSIEFFRGYLEAKFVPGMTWKNYGSHWHIDHKIPFASINIQDREQLLSVLHYTNLQPLWKEDNLRKGAKVIPLKEVS
jgi:hypothetical protein